MVELTQRFLVRFWGVRGSIPSPGPQTVRYGGNTSCVEMLIGGQRLIFDGGTGIRQLGLSLMDQMPLEAAIFFSHSHWDHIQGFPFLPQPLYLVIASISTEPFPQTGLPSSNASTIRCYTLIFRFPYG